MSTKQYLKSLEYDDIDPVSVIEVLKTILNKEGFAPEQILFCVGKVLDKNKESYIKLLKKMKGELKMENDQLKAKAEKLEAKIKEYEEKEAKAAEVKAKKPAIQVMPKKPIPQVNPVAAKKNVVVLKRKIDG